MNYFYVYLITEISTGKKYIGSRQSQIDPLIDISIYKSSSKILKEKIKSSSTDFNYKILSLHQNRKDAYDEERRLQLLYNVVNDESYYNKSIQYDKFTTLGITTVKDKDGRRYIVSTNDEKYISGEYVHVLKGYKFSDEYKRNMSLATSGSKNGFYGKTHSEKTKSKIAKKNSINFSGNKNPNAKCVSIDGTVYDMLKSACAHLKITKSVMIHRLNSDDQKWKNWFYVTHK